MTQFAFSFMFPFYASSYFHTCPAFLCMYFFKLSQAGEKRPFIFFQDQKREQFSYSWQGGALRTHSSPPHAPPPPTPIQTQCDFAATFSFLFFISNIPAFTNIWISSNIEVLFFRNSFFVILSRSRHKTGPTPTLPDFSHSLSHSLHRIFVPAFPPMAANLNTTGLYYPGLLLPYDPPFPHADQVKVKKCMQIIWPAHVYFHAPLVGIIWGLLSSLPTSGSKQRSPPFIFAYYEFQSPPGAWHSATPHPLRVVWRSFMK